MFLNIYKPPGPTSHDIVDQVRKITGERKVGHAGTLDPFAEGVLVIGVGRESTKKLGEITKNTQKEYVAVIELGKISSTGDPEGDIKELGIKNQELWELKITSIKNVLKKFEGEIEQVPPAYSAIKIKGEPAYKKARRGEKVELPKRKVKIYEIELLNTDKYGLGRINTDIEKGIISIRVVCSSGTYIRTLAEDIGKKLGTGAYVKKLIRTRVGEYKIENSVKLEELKNKLNL